MLKTKKVREPKNVTLPSTARLRPRDISLLTLSPSSFLLQSPTPPNPTPTHTHLLSCIHTHMQTYLGHYKARFEIYVVSKVL